MVTIIVVVAYTVVIVNLSYQPTPKPEVVLQFTIIKAVSIDKMNKLTACLLRFPNYVNGCPVKYGYLGTKVGCPYHYAT